MLYPICNNATAWKLLQAKHPEGPLPCNAATCLHSGMAFSLLILMYLPFSSLSLRLATACGPSSLRIQHLLNAAEIPLQCPIGSLLTIFYMYLPHPPPPPQVSVYNFLAGGSLTALQGSNKNKLKLSSLFIVYSSYCRVEFYTAWFEIAYVQLQY